VVVVVGWAKERDEGLKHGCQRELRGQSGEARALAHSEQCSLVPVSLHPCLAAS